MRQIHLGQMARMAALFAAPLLLSSCLLFFRSPRLPKLPEEKYNINEDSTFFSKMPPYSEEGKNIVAFEIDGKPYVYPKAGAFLGFIDMPSEWQSYIEISELTGNVALFFRVTRRGKKYNDSKFSFFCTFPMKEFAELSNGRFGANTVFWAKGADYSAYTKDGEGIFVKITKLDHKARIISGIFEGILKNDYTPTKTIEIKNGFFDLVYIDKRDQ